MASSTTNVKIGVCKAFFDGIDLGYTKGGVEVTVKTDTHKVNIDQFGKTPINEYIMGRECTAKVPMAETTIENMAAIMPGTTITQTGGTVASGTITFSTATAAANDIVSVNGVVFTFKAVPTSQYEVLPGATFTASAQNLLTALQASTNPLVSVCQYSIVGAVITVKYGSDVQFGLVGKQSASGNAVTLTKTATNIAVSGATLAGGADATSVSISASTGVGVDLLSVAKELRLRPVSKYNAAGVFNGDISEDFVMPLAGTAGALNFAYKLEDERVYSVEFNAYPNSATNQLYTLGA